MSNHNPELEPKHVPPAEASIQPDAPDFVETADTATLLDDRERLPVWLYLACGFFLFLAGSSFTGFTTFGMGLLDQGAGGPIAATGAGAGAQAAEPTDPMTLGAKIYGNKCASCHQPDGNGQPGKVPPLAKSEWVLGNKERLTAILLHGLSGPVTVEGASFGTQIMAPWALTDDQIADVLTYIRGSTTFGNTANPVTAAEVTAARTKLASQGDKPYSADDLMKMAPHGPDPSDKK